MSVKYIIEKTHHDDGEAEYDAADWPFQIIDMDDNLKCLCDNEEFADKLLALLNNSAS